MTSIYSLTVTDLRTNVFLSSENFSFSSRFHPNGHRYQLLVSTTQPTSHGHSSLHVCTSLVFYQNGKLAGTKFGKDWKPAGYYLKYTPDGKQHKKTFFLDGKPLKEFSPS